MRTNGSLRSGLAPSAAAVLLVWWLALPDPLAAQPSGDTLQSPSSPPPSFYYGGRPYGSDAFLGPVETFLNRGFNLSQTANRARRIFQADYGTRHVWESLTDPVGSIQDTGGWGTFFEQQILPIQAVKWIRSGFDWDAAESMAWYPNYLGHMIEGGIQARRLAEKLRAQGVPLPAVVAGATILLGDVVNEMYTHPNLRMGTGGTVADLYFFDPGGVLLFSFDPIARFFAEKVHATVWTNQVSLTVPGPLELNNAGQNLILKPPMPFVDRVSFFFRTSIGSHLGIAYHLDEEYDLSLGVGADASRQNLDPVTGRETVDVLRSASLWLDRGGSLLASLYVSEVDHRIVTVNVYPGVLHRDVGGWFVITRRDGVQFGLSHRNLLGAAFGGRIGG